MKFTSRNSRTRICNLKSSASKNSPCFYPVKANSPPSNKKTAFYRHKPDKTSFLLNLRFFVSTSCACRPRIIRTSPKRRFISLRNGKAYAFFLVNRLIGTYFRSDAAICFLTVIAVETIIVYFLLA